MQQLKVFFVQDCCLLYRVFAYTLKRKWEISLSLFFKVVVNVFLQNLLQVLPLSYHFSILDDIDVLQYP